ncbi:MAG: divergent polysaccharide deacetylase family protein [Deltaproteobacteria bacterium]|nr:divergent polysaccharide deacetylase family protein [Deltaproteobacteria bacterium]
MGRSKKKGKRKKNNGRRVTFILIPVFLALSLAFFYILKTASPGKKPGRQVVRISIPKEKIPEEGAGFRSSPQLALIIDDGGYNMENFKEMLGIGKPITYAILPFTPHAREAALLAYRDGSEVMLHLPMEPKNGEQYSLEKNTVRTGMDSKRVQKILEDALKQVPHVRGINNHMGSKATEDPQVMEALMQVLKKEGLYFIDSNTSFQTLGPEMARKAGVASRRNDQFIDREKKIEAIKNAIRLAMRKAKQEGRAVAIGHPHPLTARAIKEMISEIEKEGIRLVFASEVVG